MDNDQSSTVVSPLALGGAITGIFVLIFSAIYLFFRSPSTSKTDEVKNENETSKKESTTKKSSSSKVVKQDTKVVSKFVHPWLCVSLRAHTGSVTGLDFSHNDKYLASAAEGNCEIYLMDLFTDFFFHEDDSVLLWQTKDFNEKDHKYVCCRICLGNFVLFL